MNLRNDQYEGLQKLFKEYKEDDSIEELYEKIKKIEDCDSFCSFCSNTGLITEMNGPVIKSIRLCETCNRIKVADCPICGTPCELSISPITQGGFIRCKNQSGSCQYKMSSQAYFTTILARHNR